MRGDGDTAVKKIQRELEKAPKSPELVDTEDSDNKENEPLAKKRTKTSRRLPGHRPRRHRQ